ncbi:phage terminase small subunit-related protein [Metabacillus halosaccharovorans]|uniref:phage terminase small subunit-related protein n=1 Tax=Metabacillus halosaccharovorans TaxID=930124 RepID=UPI00384FF04F
MARKRDPNRDKAFELFKEHGGAITNREIAKQLDVLEKTISAWKSRDKWIKKMDGDICSTTKTKRSTTEKKSPTKDVRSNRKKQMIDSLVEAGTYSPALDLLIDLYLDAYEEYVENKSEKLRRELAKYLGQLGLDGKNKELIKSNGKLLAKGDEEKEKEPVPENNKLLEFRQRRKRG